MTVISVLNAHAGALRKRSTSCARIWGVTLAWLAYGTGAKSRRIRFQQLSEIRAELYRERALSIDFWKDTRVK